VKLKSFAETRITGTSGLDINDDSKKAGSFMSYDDKPPPAPKIHSRGVIATDITQRFVKATESTFLPKAKEALFD
jgi:hypothetical protein